MGWRSRRRRFIWMREEKREKRSTLRMGRVLSELKLNSVSLMSIIIKKQTEREGNLKEKEEGKKQSGALKQVQGQCNKTGIKNTNSN